MPPLLEPLPGPSHLCRAAPHVEPLSAVARAAGVVLCELMLEPVQEVAARESLSSIRVGRELVEERGLERKLGLVVAIRRRRGFVHFAAPNEYHAGALLNVSTVTARRRTSNRTVMPLFAHHGGRLHGYTALLFAFGSVVALHISLCGSSHVDLRAKAVQMIDQLFLVYGRGEHSGENGDIVPCRVGYRAVRRRLAAQVRSHPFDYSALKPSGAPRGVQECGADAVVQRDARR